MINLKKGDIVRCIKDFNSHYGKVVFEKGETYNTIDGLVIDNNGEKWNFESPLSVIGRLFEEYFESVKGVNDPINPDHYKSYSVETIDMMVAIYGKEKTAIHCELTAFKYRQRLGKKDSLEQDLAKERWYLEKARELRREIPRIREINKQEVADNLGIKIKPKVIICGQCNCLHGCQKDELDY